ncbi:Aspartokinase [Candidatus Sulfopaludibacter sp. SbA3]|nr:Aspartokinase [Candidatus Sulfopaludibacter sp. SbA3]
MIVMKFGGSSVASATAIEWVSGIVKQHLHAQPVVVVSAMGKTTDRLEEALRHAARGSSFSAWRQLEDLRQFHVHETKRLLGENARAFLDQKVYPLFHELHDTLVTVEEGTPVTPQVKDRVLSFGERLSSEIVAAVFARAGMKTTHIDACDAIVTNDAFGHAAPLLWETYARLRRTVAVAARDSVVVMGGFIGATADGRITTLGRGGSDFTASLVGAGISASEIQIWTDVDGILSCDPRVLRGGYRLRAVGYDEAAEMARLGAKVLHPDTVAPAVRQSIPITIRNSRHPDLDGTCVTPQAPHPTVAVKCIACLKDMAVIHLNVRGAAGLANFSDGLHQLFTRNHIEVHLVQARPNGVSFAVTNSADLPALLRHLDRSIAVTVEENMAVVSLVGRGITSGPGIAARVRLALQGQNVRMTAQGSSRLSMSFALPESALAHCVERLHREFFRTPGEELFAATPESARVLSTARAKMPPEKTDPGLPQVSPASRPAY